MLKKFLLIFLLSISCVFATPKYIGVDALAIAKLNVPIFLASIPNGTALGVLQGTFGNTSKNVQTILASGKVPIVRFHLLNGPCWRNKRCEKGEPNPTKDFTAIATRAKDIALYMDSKYPSIPYLISPVLEHDVTDQKTVKRWFELVKQVAPKAQLVCSPFKGWCPAGVLVEKHGNSPGNYDIVSNDGVSIFQSNSTKYREMGKLINFGWYNELNMLSDGMKTFIVPSKRTCQSPSWLYKQSMQILKAPVYDERVPSACKSVIDFTNKELLKTNAESYCTPDKRGNRHLVILNKKYADQLEVLAPNGTKIACAKYYGIYEKSQHRYYVGSCSGESSIELFQKAGNQERIYYKMPTGVCYRASAIRRLGYYK